MGDYSIAKSYKGILRIANIMQFNQGQVDELLNPYYYGAPQGLMNISGGTIGNTKEYGYPNPISGMQGTSNRYTSVNPSVADDELKLLRVPMTDSMGNYLNWNVGLDGVTIGSNGDINGNKLKFDSFKQKDTDTLIAQEINFPILETKRLIVGLVNKVPQEQKFGITEASMQVQSSMYGDDASIIIENYYDKTEANHQRLFQKTYDEEGKQILDENDNYVTKTSPWSFYKDPAAYYTLDGEKKHNYKKVRTVYKATKPTIQDYDVFMYKQDDWDYDNWQTNKPSNFTDHIPVQEQGYNDKEMLDCHVDIVNLKDYIKTKINDYLNGNVKEVPSGTVLWQYCSLKKWYARSIDPNDGSSYKNYAGNRPAMMLRQESSDEKFFNTLIQGACKKINHLINESTNNSITEEKEENANDSMKYHDDDDILDEVIPIYKRDYLLCDGSVFRIPYRPPFNNADVSNQREAFDRFINLYFAIGYKYTDRTKMANRTDFRINKKGEVILQAISPTGLTGNDIDVNVINDVSPTKNKELYNTVSDTFSPLGWIGNPPNLVNISIQQDDDPWCNLTDMDILFEMDYATMIACDILFKQYNSSSPFGVQSITAWVDMKNQDRLNKIKEWIETQGNGLFHEKYIFNSFVGDTQEQVNEYWANTGLTGEAPVIMSIPYFNYITNNTEDTPPHINMGRQVNSLLSWIRIYDHSDRKIKITKVCNLPNVQLFMMLLSTKHRIQDNINKFCYMYFNYNFQVPSLMANDFSPVFIGSGGVSWSNARLVEMKKVESWSSNFTSSSVPHRHAIFCSPIQGFNTKDPKNFQGDSLGNKTVSGSAYNGGSPSENHNRVDGKGGYIVNEIIAKWRDTGKETTVTANGVQDITGTRVKIIDIPYPEELDVSFDNIVTGSHRKQINARNNDGTETIPPQTFSWESVNGAGDGAGLNRYYEYEKDYWWSFRLQDDPRFDTGEPNRGITSPPTLTTTYSSIPITKTEINKTNFYLTNANYFAPENVKMLPLIKI